ncbi:MAG TPA: cell division protein ZapE [Rhizomicrobium sp.]|jgi:cell division protein ZapE|nr:cell division protein ZapE [Rhizomicrobium sp.]
MMLLSRYRVLVKTGELKPDAAQEGAARKLQALADALAKYRPGRSLLFGQRRAPRGLYLWGDVGRGKSMLMDLFFDHVTAAKKIRVHFNAFMADIHARIHAERARHGDDPIPPVARTIAADATVLCFDEFQVADVADAMILGRLFQQLFASGVVVVATSNTPPRLLYQGGLNRQLFLPFIAMLEQRMETVELNGSADYRLARMSGLDVYIMPLGPEADARMDAAWMRLTDTARGETQSLTVLGRKVAVPQAAKGVARFAFAELCAQPLAAADYLAIARHFHMLLIDHIPRMDAGMRNEARRFTVLIDTLYDEGVKLICSAGAAPDALYPDGDGADAFRRTASRLMEMRSVDYLKRGHGVHEAAA